MISRFVHPTWVGAGLVLVLLLAACASRATDTSMTVTMEPDPTATHVTPSIRVLTRPPATDTPTPLPVTPSLTPSPEPVATFPSVPTPAPPGVALPPPVILTQNGLPAGALARYGAGYSELELSPQGSLVARVRSIGLEMLDAQTFNSLWFYPTYYKVADLKFSADGRYVAAALGPHVVVWDSITGALIQTLAPSSWFVDAITWSPDGQHIAIANSTNLPRDENSGAISVWRWLDGQAVADLEGVTWRVWEDGLVWSPDGTLLAASTIGGPRETAFIVWDAQNFDVQFRLADDFEQYALVMAEFEFSPDSQTILLASTQGRGDVGYQSETAYLIDAHTGEVVRTYTAPDYLHGLPAYSPTGRYLVPSVIWLDSDGNRIPIWDTDTGDVIRELSLPTNEYGYTGVSSAAWSPTAAQIATEDYVNTVTIWDITRGEALHTIQAQGRVQWLPDGKQLLIGNTVWDVEDNQALRTVADTTEVFDVDLSQDGSVLAYTTDDTILIRDRSSGALLRTIRLPEGHLTRITLSPDGTLLAGMQSGLQPKVGIYVWEVASGDHVYEDGGLDGLPRPRPRSVHFTGDGSKLILHWDTYILRLDLETLETEVVSHHELGLLDMDPAQGNFVVWDNNSGALQSIEPLHLQTTSAYDRSQARWHSVFSVVYGLAVSPDGKYAALGNNGAEYDVRASEIAIIDLDTGELVRRVNGNTQEVSDILWSPDGRYLFASGGQSYPSTYGRGELSYTEGWLFMWDVTSGELVHVFDGHTAEVQGLALSADGTILASASLDGTVILWDLTTIIP